MSIPRHAFRRQGTRLISGSEGMWDCGLLLVMDSVPSETPNRPSAGPVSPTKMHLSHQGYSLILLSSCLISTAATLRHSRCSAASLRLTGCATLTPSPRRHGVRAIISKMEQGGAPLYEIAIFGGEYEPGRADIKEVQKGSGSAPQHARRAHSCPEFFSSQRYVAQAELLGSSFLILELYAPLRPATNVQLEQ